MKSYKYWAGVSMLAVFLSIGASPLESLAAAPEVGDVLSVSGIIEDTQGKGVKEVEIEVPVNGQPVGTPGQGGERRNRQQRWAFVGRYRLPVRDAP